MSEIVGSWYKIASIDSFPADGGACAKVHGKQIAIFHLNHAEKKWYATQNLCPHKRDMVIARGLIGDQCGVPKVACPHHKKTFSLETGKQLGEESYQLETFDVKEEDGYVYVKVTEKLLNLEPA